MVPFSQSGHQPHIWQVNVKKTHRFEWMIFLPYYIWAEKNTVSLTDTAKICCHQTKLLLPPKIKYAIFSAFCKFSAKFIEFIGFKGKKCPVTKNYWIMNHFEIFELIFLGVFLCTLNFSVTFFSILWSNETLLVILVIWYENKCINKRFFHSAQSAGNGKFCQFCCFLIAADFCSVWSLLKQINDFCLSFFCPLWNDQLYIEINSQELFVCSVSQHVVKCLPATSDRHQFCGHSFGCKERKENVKKRVK